MAKDSIVKIVADSKEYVKGLNEAGTAQKKFKSQMNDSSSVMNAAKSAVSRYITVAAAVKGVQEVMTRAIKGSQTSADQFAGVMAAARSTVDNFFSSLSTGDFTSFNFGLKTLVENAKEAQAALDRLGNANMSWSYFQGARTADFRDQMTIAKNADLPMEQRKAAYAEMGNILNDMKGMVEGYSRRAEEAMAEEMTNATGISWQNVGKKELEQILRLDLMAIETSEAEKARLSEQYAEYQKRAQEIRRNNSTYIKGAYDPRTGVQRPDRYIQTDEQRQKTADETRQLAASYQDAILYNKVLVRQSDEWLKNLISLVQRADAARRSMGELNNAFRETGNALNKPVASDSVTPTLRTVPFDISKMDVPGIRVPVAVEISDELPETLDNVTDGVRNLISQTDAISGLRKVWDNVTDGVRNLASQTDAISELSSAFGQVGASMSGTGDIALATAGVILQAATTAAPAFATLASSAATAAGAEAVAETPTLVGKIAAAASITATLISMHSALKSLGSYAEGGIVPGRNFTDGITARVSSGEMIINEADQKRLYDSIHTGNFGGGGGQPYVDAETIFLGLNNWGRRTGRGELVFSR